MRGQAILASADAVLHDELIDPSLLDRARRGARIEYVGKRGEDPAEKQRSQQSIDARLIELARAGLSVMRLKGGDPFLFGRGSEEAESLAEAGVPFEIVPGVTSPLAAAAYAGISLTHRDLASSVVLLSGATRKGADFDFEELSRHRGTVCVLMGLKRLPTIARALVERAGRSPETPAAVIQNGTRPDQRVVVGTLANIADLAADARLASPALVVVGDVVKLREKLRWFDERPLFGRRVLLPRAEGQAERSAEALRRRGAVVVPFPLLTIGPPPDPRPAITAARSLDTYDCVVFTSDNAVGRFFDIMAEEGLDARAFGRALVAAIGGASAASLARYGIRADVTPKGASRAETLLDALVLALEARRGKVEGARVLVPRALVAREVLPEELRKRGATVDVVPVYRTDRAGAERHEELLRVLDGGIDGVLLSSGSMAESLADVLNGATLPARTKVVCIGEITTAAAEARGLPVHRTASLTSAESLADALVAALAIQ